MSVDVMERTPAFFPYQAFCRRSGSDGAAGLDIRVPAIRSIVEEGFRAQFLVADRAANGGYFDDAAPWRYEIFEGYVRWGSSRGGFELEFAADPAWWRDVAGQELPPLLWLFESTLIELALARTSQLSIWVGPVAYDPDALRPFDWFVPRQMPAAARPRPSETGRHATRPAADGLRATAVSLQRRTKAIVHSDEEWWGLVASLSEDAGAFEQQFGGRDYLVDFGIISNEDSAQTVIPALKASVAPGGVYVGVGPEQNFTYIAATRPSVAFIVDIRRDNLIQHLMYKALFELSTDRVDFLSRLFSRRRPSGLGAQSSVTVLCDAFQATRADARLYDDNRAAIVDRLVRVHGCGLTGSETEVIGRILKLFFEAGLCALEGAGTETNLSYAQLMAGIDGTGRHQSYLASEEHFRSVQELQRRNLVVPLVGDVAGDKALAGIGRYLRERDMRLSTFYVSNVERYLFDRADRRRRFYENLATIPLEPGSVFIRAVSRQTSRRLGIRIPIGAERWRTFLSPIPAALTECASGRIQTYRDLFTAAY